MQWLTLVMGLCLAFSATAIAESVDVKSLESMRNAGYCRDTIVTPIHCNKQCPPLGEGDHSREDYAEKSACHRQCDTDNAEINLWNKHVYACIEKRRKEAARERSVEEKIRQELKPIGGPPPPHSTPPRNTERPSKVTAEKDPTINMRKPKQIGNSTSVSGKSRASGLDGFNSERDKREFEKAVREKARQIQQQQREAAEAEQLRREEEQAAENARNMSGVADVLLKGTAAAIQGYNSTRATTPSAAPSGSPSYGGSSLVVPGRGENPECFGGPNPACR